MPAVLHLPQTDQSAIFIYFNDSIHFRLSRLHKVKSKEIIQNGLYFHQIPIFKIRSCFRKTYSSSCNLYNHNHIIHRYDRIGNHLLNLCISHIYKPIKEKKALFFHNTIRYIRTFGNYRAARYAFAINR
jgi:hypothetical protein